VIALAMAASLFAVAADARADFEKWSNRSARVLEPADYKTNGTCCEAICTWKGVGGIGNMGIGDGNISLMEPDVISEMTANAMQPTGGNESYNAPAGNSTGNRTLVSRDANNELALPEETADGPSTESLYPDYDLAASVIPRSAPYSITINTPFEHILAEEPVEAAALYGKLLGFTMPGGQVVDVGVKCIGYEY